MPLYETMEQSSKNYLKTRWYKNSYSECKAAVLEIVNIKKGVLLDINDKYQEILFNFSFNEAYIKITNVNDLCAIEINLSTWFFNGKRIINEFYNYLNGVLVLSCLGVYK